jgi:hypothetical protein
MGSRAALAISDIPAAQGVGEPSPSVVCERGAKAASSDKIMELAERAGALRNLECRQALELGIAVRRGGVLLTLTDDRYAKLKAKGYREQPNSDISHLID